MFDEWSGSKVSIPQTGGGPICLSTVQNTFNTFEIQSFVFKLPEKKISMIIL